MKKIISLILSVIMAASLLATTAFAQAGMSNFKKTLTYTQGKFSDVASNDWFSQNVAAAYEYGLVQGVSSNSFGAASNVKISEVVALAARLHSIYNTGSASFTQGEPWYQPYLDYAVTNGVIAKNRFENYDEYATRYQLAEIFAAALPSSALSAINNISIGSIPDVSLESSYTSVYSLYNAGVLTGKTDAGNFYPAENVLRSEVAAVVTRMADPSLRVRFSISSSSNSNGGITSGAKLLETVNNGRQTVVLALQSYNAAYAAIVEYNKVIISVGDSDEVKAEKAAKKAEYLLAAKSALAKADEYTMMAATYAQHAAAFCKANSKYSKAYDNVYNSYLGCIEASKNIAIVAAVPATADWTRAQTLLSGCGEALSTAYTTINTIG